MMQARLLGNAKALLVLRLGTLEPDILGHCLVGHIAAARDEVATRPQVPAPERLAQLPPVHQEVMGGLALDRLHHAARSQMGGHIEQQVHMVRPDVPAQDFDIVRAADLPDQIAHLDRDVAFQDSGDISISL